MTEQTQLEFLQAAKAELDVTWDELATLADIAPRALKTYRLPPASAEYRGMPKLAHNAIVGVLEKNRKQRKKSFLTWYAMRTILFHIEAQFSAAKWEKLMKRYELFYGKDYQQHFVADAYAETPRKAVQFFASYYPEDAANVKGVTLIKDGGMFALVHPRHWKH